ncbi:histidine phosphatase family protein [Metabacillus litoralis]|uniref:histidine phosphatase family protein n=1 Tax=Metabacillus litoralis TaxID=152268 RepID=UPI0027D7DED4|nr:histidine phosphatase family protein [Metabacillus litoralis]
MKKIYVVRHCEAQGQDSNSKLTEKGLIQSKSLSDFFSTTRINRIISSPYIRAIQSVVPISEEKNIKVEINVYPNAYLVQGIYLTGLKNLKKHMKIWT